MDLQWGSRTGRIELTLDPVKAPLRVKHFLEYVESGFYTGTIFDYVYTDDYDRMTGGISDTQLQRKTGWRSQTPRELLHAEYYKRGSGLHFLLDPMMGEPDDYDRSQFYIDVDKVDESHHIGEVTAGFDFLIAIVDYLIKTLMVPADPNAIDYIWNVNRELTEEEQEHRNSMKRRGKYFSDVPEDIVVIRAMTIAK